MERPIRVGVFLACLLPLAGLVAGALENWPLIALIAFPEGFINGMLLSVLVVWYPDTVKTFDSVKYLGD